MTGITTVTMQRTRMPETFWIILASGLVTNGVVACVDPRGSQGIVVRQGSSYDDWGHMCSECEAV